VLLSDPLELDLDLVVGAVERRTVSGLS